MHVLFLSVVHLGSSKTRRIGTSRNEEYLNPDIAIGNQFHVAAKQWDGTRRCFFIDVGNRIEQGPTNMRSNEQCAQAYRKEIALGRYNGTLPPDSSPKREFLQQYVKGDSAHCGEVVLRQQRKGVVLPGNAPRPKQVQRQTVLMMIKNEGEVGITARVREPRRCEYEVVLEGPQQLLLGGATDDVAFVDPKGGAVGASRGSQTRKKRPSNSHSNPANVGASSKAPPASETRARSKYSEGKYQEAVNVVTQSSHEDLVSRSAKELKKLLRNLDADCKACNDKVQFVDRLKEIVRGKDEL